jgi:hypothetical protein
MSKTPREWLLDRDREALVRLDEIRGAALRDERATFAEVVAEFFRPNLPAWTLLAAAWIALLGAHLALAPYAGSGPEQAGRRPDLANLTLTTDETLSLLDPRS